MHSRFKVIAAFALGTALVAGCANAQSKTKKSKSKPAAAKVMKQMDSDVAAVGGTGVPVGYFGRADRPTQKLSDAKYVKVGNGWDVTTGPAHILWNPKQTATGNYTVTAIFDQLETPKHPESYGIFIGGSDLEGAGQSYLYFLVRGSGEAFAQTRKGDVLTGRIAWQKSAAVPMADASGKGTYTLSMRVAGDSVHFLVNGNGVAVLPKKDIPTDGIYGIRINHNLHVHATPVAITRP
ncbi:MAG: hypothetical protein M3Z17_09215 [Gemmatimonadota bacterium]|nr:hypothetical protein [Gemmatimonadota bacterium]